MDNPDKKNPVQDQLKTNNPIGQPETTTLHPHTKKFYLLLIILGVIFLTSIFMAALYYIGSRISVNKQKQSVSKSANVQKSPTPTFDQTANWKIYRDDGFRFEFKYPNNFTYNNCSYIGFDLTDLVNNGSVYCAEITFPKDAYSILLSVKNIKNIDEAVKGIPLSSDYNLSKLIVNNNEFTKVQRISNNNHGNYGDSYFIQVPKRPFILEFYLVRPSRTLTSNITINYQEILDQILSTFKFLNQDKTDLKSLIAYQIPTGWKEKIIPPAFTADSEHIVLESPDFGPPRSGTLPSGMVIEITKKTSENPDQVFYNSLHPTPFPSGYQSNGHEYDNQNFKELTINGYKSLSFFYTFESDIHYYWIINKKDIWIIRISPSENTRLEYKTIINNFLNSISFRY
ncbi:MAG: hypothetical protein A2857_00935 [Candidatus Levybacteria bacterium RIFCSPHIGHO2_01_FULL_36_15]|nr:MAG: hypothetical protein A2857_00935 [Candidatus Levybacteria bacterium RIFCSPHIGHO2_01_FULL_36_15]